jgi:hypothetical protein
MVRNTIPQKKLSGSTVVSILSAGKQISLRRFIMKKVLVAFVSVIIVSSFSSVVFASIPVTPCTVQLTKQVVLSEDDPTPAPSPAPVPAPEPEPK